MKHFCANYHLKNLVKVPTCYKNTLKLSCIDFTQFPRYSGNRNRVLRFSQDEYDSLEDVFFSEQEHETVVFQNYKKFNSSAFKEALNRELLKYESNNIEHDTFQEITVSFLNVYAPLQ